MKEMRTISIVWGVFLVLIFGLLTTFGVLYKNKMKPYKDMERSLVDASKKYVEIEFSYPQDGSSLKISSADLQEKASLPELKHDDDVCEGYAVVKKKSGAYDYKGYIKCPSYTTKGFEAS